MDPIDPKDTPPADGWPLEGASASYEPTEPEAPEDFSELSEDVEPVEAAEPVAPAEPVEPPLGAVPPPPPPPPPPAPAPFAAPGPRVMTAQDRTTWAIGAHLSAIVASFIALAFVGPLVVWLIKKDEDVFVGAHALEALNFQLSFMLYLVGATILAVVTFGIGVVLFLPLGVMWLVFVIMATMAASRGETYSYPLTIRFIK